MAFSLSKKQKIFETFPEKLNMIILIFEFGEMK